MKVIVCGSRAIQDYNLLIKTIKESEIEDKIEVILSRGCSGPDKMGELWAKEKGIGFRVFEAKWKECDIIGVKLAINSWGQKYNKLAELARNSRMIEKADAVIALWNGKSKGTLDTINKAKKKGILVYISSA